MACGNGKHSAYERWINNYKVANAWISKHDVERAVDANGGLVRIEDFLPEFVAEGIFATIAAVSEEQWNDTSASTDYRQNNISHSFSSVKHASGLDAVLRLFSLVRPGSLNAFSAARYCKQDHIAPHDDRAYTKVKLDSGRVITTSRTLAVIYYLTRNWREEDGGVLLDLEDPSAPPGRGRKYVPRWNSVVAFRVPRYHAVTPMATSRPRYSIFGWFLEPGKLYELYKGEGEGGNQQAQVQKQGGPHSEAAGRQVSGAKRSRGADGSPDVHVEAVAGNSGGHDGTSSVAQSGTAKWGESHRRKQQPQQGRQREEADERQQQNPQQQQQRPRACADGSERQPGQGRRAPRERRQEGGGEGELGGGAGKGRPTASSEPHTDLAPADRLGEPGGRRSSTAAAAASELRERAAGVRLPGKWQGRRKHVCVG